MADRAARAPALVDELELPLPDAAVDRVLLVHALEMSHDPTALLREIWRVLASGGRLLAVMPNRRGLWARMDTTPFGHGRPYSRSQITHLLRETWFTPIGWGEALYVPPIAARLVPALGGGLGAHRRDHLGAVRRRAYRRGDQAGLSRDSGAAGKAPAGAGARAGAGAVARRRGATVLKVQTAWTRVTGARFDRASVVAGRPAVAPCMTAAACRRAGRDGGAGGDAAGSGRRRSLPIVVAVRGRSSARCLLLRSAPPVMKDGKPASPLASAAAARLRLLRLLAGCTAGCCCWLRPDN